MPVDQQLVIRARAALDSAFGANRVPFASKGIRARKTFVVDYTTLSIKIDGKTSYTLVATALAPGTDT